MSIFVFFHAKIFVRLFILSINDDNLRLVRLSLDNLVVREIRKNLEPISIGPRSGKKLPVDVLFFSNCIHHTISGTISDRFD
jgi:hypothetical protein